MLFDSVKNTAVEYHLFRPNETVIVGVSGGPDSLALLYILNRLKKEFKIRLHVAHLDHKLRADSHRDRVFVESVCQRLKIPCTTDEINVKAVLKKARGSAEELARNVRLGFLFRVARHNKTNTIALGHNLDDQAETVLMRIIRGTGLYGLAGIMPKREISGFYIVRPLIKVKRQEIERYLARLRVNPRIDETNKQEIFFRNKIRKKLIPALERAYNPNIKEVLASLGESVALDYDFIKKKAYESKLIRGSFIPMRRLTQLHSSIRRIIIREHIKKLQGTTRRITYRHMREVEDLIDGRPNGSIVDLPQGVSVIKKKNSLAFLRR